jgi:hypothetical protein
MSIILVNAVFTFFSTNWAMAYPKTRNIAHAMDVIFLCFYSCELFLGMAVHRVYFFCNMHWRWNIFDFILVGAAIYDLIDTSNAKHSTAFMRILRVLKMGKLIPMIRVMSSVEQLRIFLKCLTGSIASLFWGLVMMLLLFSLFGILFVQGMTAHFAAMGDQLDPDQEEVLMEMFGSVQAVVLNLFMATTGGRDWSDYFWALYPTGAYNVALFLFFIAFTQIVFMNILTGLFVESALKHAQPEKGAMVFRHRKEQLQHKEELTRLARDLDSDKDGRITLEHFSEQLKRRDSGARHFMEALGLDQGDAELFFSILMMSHSSGVVSVADFVSGGMKLFYGSGTRLELEVSALAYQTEEIMQHQAEEAKQLNSIEERLRNMTAHVESAAGKAHLLSLRQTTHFL